MTLDGLCENDSRRPSGTTGADLLGLITHTRRDTAVSSDRVSRNWPTPGPTVDVTLSISGTAKDMESLLDELLELEHAGWRSLCDSTGGRFHGDLMADNARMVLANGVVLSRAAVIESPKMLCRGRPAPSTNRSPPR